jgi:hypothetical protein
MTTYRYQDKINLTCAELFFWITVEKTLEQLGVEDIGAVLAILAGQPILSTRAKVGGATRGTSVASVVGRQMLSYGSEDPSPNAYWIFNQDTTHCIDKELGRIRWAHRSRCGLVHRCP